MHVEHFDIIRNANRADPEAEGVVHLAAYFLGEIRWIKDGLNFYPFFFFSPLTSYSGQIGIRIDF